MYTTKGRPDFLAERSIRVMNRGLPNDRDGPCTCAAALAVFNFDCNVLRRVSRIAT